MKWVSDRSDLRDLSDVREECFGRIPESDLSCVSTRCICLRPPRDSLVASIAPLVDEVRLHIAISFFLSAVPTAVV